MDPLRTEYFDIESDQFTLPPPPPTSLNDIKRQGRKNFF